MTKVKFKQINDKAVLPVKGSKDAACFDLTIANIAFIGKNRVTVHLGFSTEIEPGYKAVIVPRSSFTQKGWIMQNSPGQIDSDYRGEWMIKFEAIPTSMGSYTDDPFLPGALELKYSKFPYKVGDRVAQCYLEKVESVDWEEQSELQTTDRGEGGFGSTGK